MSKRSNQRRTAALFAGAAIATSSLFAGGAAATPATAEAKPKINMERVLVAAQLDQYRPSNGKTAGAVKSVRRIQKQLRRRGFSVAVDGNFGAQTVSGYAAWQRRLGYSGLDASGMPGETSLKRLAGKRFRVIRVVRQGARRAFRGVTLNARTIAMVKAAGRKNGRCRITPSKGSYLPAALIRVAMNVSPGRCAEPHQPALTRGDPSGGPQHPGLRRQVGGRWTVSLGDAENPAQRACSEAHGRGHPEDVDGDGDLDLVLHFRTQETGIDPGDTRACLTGATLDGRRIEGCDSIRTG